MFHILMFFFLASGALGVGYSLYKNNSKQRVEKLLSFSQTAKVNTDGRAEKSKEIRPIERLLLRTNKMVSLTNMLDKNIIAKVFCVAVVAFTLYVLDIANILALSKNVKIIIISLISIVVIIVPDRLKNAIIKRRIKRISDDIPFIIDMMAVCVQSGMTIEYSLRYLAENTDNINPDIAAMLERVMIKNEVSGIADALDLMYNEVPCNEMRMLCTTLQQSIKYGSSIYIVLMELSKEIREMQLLTLEENISSLSAKMSLPMMIFIMFPILVMVGGPGIIRMMTLWGS